jgi:uncharacterized protein (TIRG00374 family)
MLSKRQVVTGITLWLLVFGAFVILTGPEEFRGNIDAISYEELAVMLVAVAAGVVSMGLCLYVLARNLGLGLSAVESVFLNAAVSLAHNLTPFGQAGGIPVGAAIVSTRSTSRYEEILAALSMKDIVSFVPAILIFVFVGPYLLLVEQSIPATIRPILGAFSLFVVLICGLVVAIHRNSARAHRLLQRIAAGVNRTVARLPRVPALDADELERRLDDFSDSLGELASHRPTVVLASAFATGSFLAQGTLVWLTFGAIGVEIPLSLAIFSVPVSLLASGLPLPGGTGGVEAVQITVITVFVGVATGSATTAVVLSRGLVFWTPIVLGTLTLLALNIHRRRTGGMPEGTDEST